MFAMYTDYPRLYVCACESVSLTFIWLAYTLCITILLTYSITRISFPNSGLDIFAENLPAYYSKMMSSLIHGYPFNQKVRFRIYQCSVAFYVWCLFMSNYISRTICFSLIYILGDQLLNSIYQGLHPYIHAVSKGTHKAYYTIIIIRHKEKNAFKCLATGGFVVLFWVNTVYMLSSVHCCVAMPHKPIYWLWRHWVTTMLLPVTLPDCMNTSMPSGSKTCFIALLLPQDRSLDAHE